MKRILVFAIALLMLLASAVSCSGGRVVRFTPTTYTDNDDSASALTVSIGYAAKGEPGFEDVFIEKARAEVESKGYIFELANAGMDAEQQSADISALIERGVMCIIVNPVDVDSLGAAIEECDVSGVKVINILDPINAKVNSLICPDYNLIGRKGARLAKEAKKDNRYDSVKVFLMETAADSFTMQMIHDGFAAEIEDDSLITGIKHYSDSESISADVPGANTVFAFSEELGNAAVSAGGVSVIYIGGSLEILNKISASEAYATIFYGPGELASKAVAEAIACAEDALYEPPEYIELTLGVASRSSIQGYLDAAPEGYPDPTA